MRRPVVLAAAVLSLLAARPASAWVSTYLENVDVDVALDPDGVASSTVTARYVVLGGKLRELRLLGVRPDAEFDSAASWVETERGDRYGLETYGRRAADAVLRLRIAGGAFVPRGAALCRIVLRESLVESGQIRADGDSTVVDWTPPVFPEGMGRMTVTVTLAGSGPAPTFRVEESLVPILEPVSSGRTLRLSRFRPAQLYAFPVRFVVSSAELPLRDAPATAAGRVEPPSWRAHRSTAPVVVRSADPRPLLAALPLLAIVLLASRAWHASRTGPASGGVVSPLLLARLGAPLRWPLVASLLAAGSILLIGGRTLPGLGLHALGVLLALPDRFRWLDHPRAGAGPWRSLAAPSPRTWRSLAAAAHRSRRSILDPSGPAGLLLAITIVGGTAAAIRIFLASDLAATLVVSSDAAILLLPAFLCASERALPPVLPAESAVALARVRRGLLRRRDAGAVEIGYLLQDDAGGRPADVRLRVLAPKAEAVRSAEIAVEWRNTTWGWCPSFVVLLMVPPGSRLRCGTTRLPPGTEFRLARDLRSEIWWFRAATPGRTVRTLIRALRDVERAIVDADPSRSAEGTGAQAGVRAAA